MTPTIKGALKSKTMWAGGLLTILSLFAPVAAPALAAVGLHAGTIQWVGTGMGLLMGYLRTVTNQSLADKGTQNAQVQPPSAPAAGSGSP
jgi:hypothetical protein